MGGVKLNAVWAALLFCPKHLRYSKTKNKTKTNALAVETCIREHNTLIWVLFLIVIKVFLLFYVGTIKKLSVGPIINKISDYRWRPTLTVTTPQNEKEKDGQISVANRTSASGNRKSDYSLLRGKKELRQSIL
jgi:hypothetical protein